MPEPIPAPRFVLRDLPLPAKLVVTVFLLSVGLGYTSAMIQLHMGHSSKDGNPLPTPADVQAIFAGKVWRSGNEDRLISKLEEIISGESKGKLTKQNMAPAFFGEDGADYAELVKKDPLKVNAEREGERKATLAWLSTAPEARKKAYNDDRFPLPPNLADQPITAAFKPEPGAVKIQSMLMARCARCHKPDGEKSGIPLHTHDDLAVMMPKDQPVPAGGGFVDSGRQMTLGALTQSTHAHLLSFAVLFSLTGLTFAFTSFPRIVRIVFGPIVLIAQVADVSCWWLARLPESGPYFALCILATGGVVGVGLGVQIIFSLFNMYGQKGKFVLAVMFGLAGGVAGLTWVNIIEPYLKDEKIKAQQVNVNQPNGEGKAKEGAKKADAPKKDEKKADVPKTGKVDAPPATGPSRLEVLLTGPWMDGPWPQKGQPVPPGGMVRAFFDKERDFDKAFKSKDPELPTLTADREGEQAGLLAWIKATPEAREQAYKDDKFVIPDALRGKPLTDEYRDGTAIKVRALIEGRCQKCHSGTDKIPLDTFEGLEKYLQPTAQAALAPAPARANSVASRVEPIPPAKD